MSANKPAKLVNARRALVDAVVEESNGAVDQGTDPLHALLLDRVGGRHRAEFP